MKYLQLLLALHKGWSSKTLILGRLLAFLPTVDLAFFGGSTGQKILEWTLGIVHLIPFLSGVTDAQMTSFLVVVLGGFIVWLRGVTTVPIAEKMQ
jgi:hypothetical protein